MNISPTVLALVAALSALGGVLLTSLFNLWGSHLTRKSEERKHQRQLVINAAIENWKKACDIALTKKGAAIYPLDSYIIRMMKLSELCMEQKIDASNVEQKLKEIDEIGNIVDAHVLNTTLAAQNRNPTSPCT